MPSISTPAAAQPKAKMLDEISKSGSLTYPEFCIEWRARWIQNGSKRKEHTNRLKHWRNDERNPDKYKKRELVAVAIQENDHNPSSKTSSDPIGKIEMGVVSWNCENCHFNNESNDSMCLECRSPREVRLSLADENSATQKYFLNKAGRHLISFVGMCSIVCDGCKKNLPLGSTVHGCRSCDYDLCDDCFAAAAVSPNEWKQVLNCPKPHRGKKRSFGDKMFFCCKHEKRQSLLCYILFLVITSPLFFYGYEVIWYVCWMVCILLEIYIQQDTVFCDKVFCCCCKRENRSNFFSYILFLVITFPLFFYGYEVAWYVINGLITIAACTECKNTKDRINCRNGLEGYCYNLKNMFDDEDKVSSVSSEDKEIVEEAVQEALEWLDENQEAEKEDYEAKVKEIEGIVNPIIQTMTNNDDEDNHDDDDNET